MFNHTIVIQVAIEKNKADKVKLEELENISHYWKSQGEKEKVAENERKLRQHKILMAIREEKVAENEKVRSLEKELELNNFIEQFNHENPDKFKQGMSYGYRNKQVGKESS